MSTPNVLAYYCPVAPEKKRWLALLLLPKGEIWGVNCYGATEERAVGIARTLYASEVAKKRCEDGKARRG